MEMSARTLETGKCIIPIVRYCCPKQAYPNVWLSRHDGQYSLLIMIAGLVVVAGKKRICYFIFKLGQHTWFLAMHALDTKTRVWI